MKTSTIAANKRGNHVYYDLSFYNDSTAPQPISLYDNRSSALIQNPNDYYLSIVRFTVPTSYIPIFIWQEATAGSNLPDNAYYSITLNGNQQFLTYVPQNQPAISTNPQNLFVYSYQQFIDAINVSLNLAFLAVGGSATSPPYMIYDAQTGLVSLIAETAYANTTNYQIYFGSTLFSFFDNFEVNRLGVGLSLGKDVQFLIKNNGNNDFSAHPPNYPSGIASYRMTQEYDSLFLWNSARALVFTTNTVPVADEAINIRNSQSSSTGNVYRKILTDFEINIQSGISNNTVRSYVQYVPQGEYRLISLNGDSPLYVFDMQVFFQTSNLQLYPLFINHGESVSVKCLFRDKSFQFASICKKSQKANLTLLYPCEHHRRNI